MQHYPDHSEVLSTFEAEITRLGGTAGKPMKSESGLFLRATLPTERDVAPRDTIRHGVALRATDTDLVIHPYTYRLICANGAIHVNNIASVSIGKCEESWQASEVDRQLRAAIQRCASPEAFQSNLTEMEKLQAIREVRMAIVMATVLERVRDHAAVSRIMQSFVSGTDRSGFGLMNAVTAVARQEPRPDHRWKLEALGGGMLALLKRPVPTLTGGATLLRRKPLPKPDFASCE